jgi:hypothetical protein
MLWRMLGGSTALAEDDGELSSMLSILPKRGEFVRGVACACGHVSCSLLFPIVCSSWRGVRAWDGPKMKRLAGVALGSSPLFVRPCRDAVVGPGVWGGSCAVNPWRRFDCGFAFGFCNEGGAGAKKRRGEGVLVGIATSTWTLAVRGRYEEERVES